MARLRYAHIKLYAFILLLAGIMGYAAFQSKNIILGPVVSIVAPRSAATVSSSVIEVSGTARNISSISMDGRSIFIDEAGSFREKLLLTPGYNIITVNAQDKFGRATTKTLELIYN